MMSEETISFITPFDSGYPERLKNIPDAPAGLYIGGRLPEDTEIAVAVVGARECSEYGRYVAQKLGAFLGENKVTVVSGMARGIDGISQWAALEAGGTSIGVLGCGPDICYPAQNRKLYDRLLRQGAVLSEYALGTPPKPAHFPARNRIVSGLSDAVVVVEAREKSGTLITVDMALEQGREVFVVPGRITDSLSDGCNRLIRQGAGILLSPRELLTELQELKHRTKERDRGETETEKKKKRACKVEKRQTDVSPEEKALQKEPDMGKEIISERFSREMSAVYQALDFYPRSLAQIMAFMPDRSAISQRQVLSQLMRLCMEGKAVQVSSGYFCRSGQDR